MRYRKKPVEVEAIQLTQDNMVEVLTFCNHKDIIASSEGSNISIKTLEGTMIGNVGDYIIKGVAGEFYPCKPDIFEATYEPAKNEMLITPDEMLATAAPTWVDMRMTLIPEDIATIAEWLDNDPRMKKVEFDADWCQLHFEVEYGEEVGPDAATWASFTIYEGTTIIRENGIYRTECKNGQ